MWRTSPAHAAAHRVPADFTTINAAIVASSAGDTVLVAAGTYLERVALAAGVTLRAESGPGTAVIDAGQSGATVEALGLSPPARLEGFRLTGGSGSDLGGATLGGNLAVIGGGLVVSDCTFDGAHANYGGATGASNAAVTFRRCTWSGATATFGGAHFQAGGTLTLEDGVINGTSASAGGGLYVTGGADVTVLGCDLTGTQASGDGGGLHLDAAAVSLSNLRVDGAQAGGHGGGIAIAAGGQVIASFSVLVDCGSGLGGGAFHVSCDSGSPRDLPGARAPATLAADCALLTMTNCDLLVSRGAAPAAGGVTGAAVLRITSSIVAGNASGLACLDPRATLNVSCSDLYRNGGPDLSGSCVPIAPPGSLSVDPRLCNLAGRDFGLCANSPLIDPGCGDTYWGAGGASCAACGPTPATPATWGRLKVLYRG
jgi:hypothetical protein